MRGSRDHPRKKENGKTSKTSLRDEVRDALLGVLRDPAAPPTARAIAGRSLIQLIGEQADSDDKKPANAMSLAELDEEIASLQPNQR